KLVFVNLIIEPKNLAMDNRFTEIIQLIHQSRIKAYKSVNTVLIDLYWKIGKSISNRVESSEWGKSVVTELAEYIQNNEPKIKGFSDKNLWRMKQFYETYKDFPKLSTLSREIGWSSNLTIISRCKSAEEREFYLKLTQKENYSVRELERQISSSTFERVMIGNEKLSPALREIEFDLSNTFKDTYVLDFLNLKKGHSEKDLQL